MSANQVWPLTLRWKDHKVDGKQIKAFLLLYCFSSWTWESPNIPWPVNEQRKTIRWDGFLLLNAGIHEKIHGNCEENIGLENYIIHCTDAMTHRPGCQRETVRYDKLTVPDYFLTKCSHDSPASLCNSTHFYKVTIEGVSKQWFISILNDKPMWCVRQSSFKYKGDKATVSHGAITQMLWVKLLWS